MNDFRTAGLMLTFLSGCLCPSGFTADLLPCTPVPFENTPLIGPCVQRDPDGRLSLTKEALGTLVFDANGLAAVSIEGVLYHANRTGRTAPALPFENGADYLVEGLTRIRRNGKIGFVDGALQEVIDARWDFAFPFNGGVAVVCLGCRHVKDGEHVAVVGGQWGYIDKRGRVVVPVRYTQHTLPPVPAATEATREDE